MYQALNLKFLLENGMNVNEPIITTGEFAGFTALHIACMKNNQDHLVRLLVNDYKADVNAMAADGTQPLHLACFYEPINELKKYLYVEKVGSKIETLVKANANVNAKFGQEIFSKHVKDKEWCPDFGDKMPLVAYTVIYDKPSINYHLKKVNLDIISLTNKTLLMYAVEKNYCAYISVIMSNAENPELIDKLINHRDNDGVPLTHYPFYSKKIATFPYNEIKSFDIFYSPSFISNLVSWGADMYALVNNDPATFLPNLVAYRSCSMLLKDLLPYYTSMSLSRVLYYATHPIKNPEHLLRNRSGRELSTNIFIIRKNREDCIAYALKDLVFRSVFKLPVPEQEIKLMNELIASHQSVRKIVNDYKRNFIEKELQERFIEFGDNKMTMYDFFMQVFDYRKLKLLAREKNLLDALDKFFHLDFENNRLFQTYHHPIQIRIKDAKERLAHLENLKKISSLRKAIPLPFELILDIVEYLNNNQLNLFIKAFYSS